MSLKRNLGYFLLATSLLAWSLVLVVPFGEFTKTQMVAISTSLIIAGEVTFYVSILLLGKEIWEKIKGIFKRNK